MAIPGDLEVVTKCRWNLLRWRHLGPLNQIPLYWKTKLVRFFVYLLIHNSLASPRVHLYGIVISMGHANINTQHGSHAFEAGNAALRRHLSYLPERRRSPKAVLGISDTAAKLRRPS